MPLLQHLQELAVRLKRCLYAFIIALIAISSLPNPFHPFGGPQALFGYDFLLIALVDRAEDFYAKGYNLISTTVISPVSVFINLSLVLAVLISLPYIFYQIYGFITPGLYQREKRVVRKYLLPFSILLVIGGFFGLFVIFPVVMRILLDFYAPLNVAKLLPLEDFINLLMIITAMVAVGFTFPVFIVPFVELKVLSAKQLSSARKWVYVGVALSVSIANPDPTDISSIPIVVPILVLYEITIFVAKRIEKNRLKKAQLNPLTR